ncbi:septal ring lytic transglycosylase RlpA family protein [Methylobacterium brachiatum]|uniref:septal ring lytic transglycosylase RlpA family protein n=1 Tax=Methylobacterium brachiatum TaxID=269660 RepID=UPI002446ACF2|nr:septal ring lytic transglycosylase RlpA family protein [Methylobacterium brachiatum]MDH2313319.1 septal ring lytic transglycosylase RlpA family protein [Methylobacterium brachiatum]
MTLRLAARAALACLVLAGSASCAHAEVASWYGSGHHTANGERFAPDGLTAAHRFLPFGTRVRVTYGGRSVVVRINDRGPFIAGRAIDLSRGAARAIGLSGVGRVHLAILG